MDKIKIRKARPEDKEAILSIHGNVFEGRDYLPAYFDHFLTFPQTLAAVVLFDGRIVCVYFIFSAYHNLPTIKSYMFNKICNILSLLHKDVTVPNSFGC